MNHYYLLGRSGLRVSRLALGTMNFGTDGFHAAYGKTAAQVVAATGLPSRETALAATGVSAAVAGTAAATRMIKRRFIPHTLTRGERAWPQGDTLAAFPGLRHPLFDVAPSRSFGQTSSAAGRGRRDH